MDSLATLSFTSWSTFRLLMKMPALKYLLREEMATLSSTDRTPMMPVARRSSVKRHRPLEMASRGLLIRNSLPL